MLHPWRSQKAFWRDQPVSETRIPSDLCPICASNLENLLTPFQLSSESSISSPLIHVGTANPGAYLLRAQPTIPNCSFCKLIWTSALAHRVSRASQTWSVINILDNFKEFRYGIANNQTIIPRLQLEDGYIHFQMLSNACYHNPWSTMHFSRSRYVHPYTDVHLLTKWLRLCKNDRSCNFVSSLNIDILLERGR